MPPFNPDTSNPLESGVWWKGELSPMSMDGIRTAMRDEETFKVVSSSDIRWVAWPCLGQRVHVAQIDELSPIWAETELKRIKHQLLSSLLLMGMCSFGMFRRMQVGYIWFAGVCTALLLFSIARDIRSMVRLQRDPVAWGRSRERGDARRAGLNAKA